MCLGYFRHDENMVEMLECLNFLPNKFPNLFFFSNGKLSLAFWVCFEFTPFNLWMCEFRIRWIDRDNFLSLKVRSEVNMDKQGQLTFPSYVRSGEYE